VQRFWALCAGVLHRRLSRQIEPMTLDAPTVYSFAPYCEYGVAGFAGVGAALKQRRWNHWLCCHGWVIYAGRALSSVEIPVA
jgi:hypothetical protein